MEALPDGCGRGEPVRIRIPGQGRRKASGGQKVSGEYVSIGERKVVVACGLLDQHDEIQHGDCDFSRSGHEDSETTQQASIKMKFIKS